MRHLVGQPQVAHPRLESGPTGPQSAEDPDRARRRGFDLHDAGGASIVGAAIVAAFHADNAMRQGRWNAVLDRRPRHHRVDFRPECGHGRMMTVHKAIRTRRGIGVATGVVVEGVVPAMTEVMEGVMPVVGAEVQAVMMMVPVCRVGRGTERKARKERKRC